MYGKPKFPSFRLGLARSRFVFAAWAFVVALSPVSGRCVDKISLETTDTRTAVRTEPFQETSYSVCSGATCDVTLRPVPKRAWLDVTSVSCLFSDAEEDNLPFVAVFDDADRAVILVPRKVGTSGTETTYVLNHSMKFRVDGRHEVKVQFSALKHLFVGNASCKVAGELAYTR